MKNGTIRPLNQNDMPQVIDLWHIVFGDTKEFISSLFAHLPIDEIGWGLFVSPQELGAIAFTLPLNIPQQKGYYLYACATSPDRQGQGLQSKLIQELIQEHRKQGTNILLALPATESLFSFYARFGFQNVSFVREKAPVLTTCSPINSSQYLYQRFNNQHYPAIESETYLHWSISTLQNEGFHTYATPLPDRTVYTLSRPTDSAPLVADSFTLFHSNAPNLEELQFSSVTGMALELSECIEQKKYYFSFLQDE